MLVFLFALRHQEAGTECRENSAPCCWHQDTRPSEKCDRKHLPSKPRHSYAQHTLPEWRVGIMGSWTADLKPKLSLGVYPTAEGGLGLEEVRGLAGPFQGLCAASCLCHSPSSKLSLGATERTRGKGRTASDTRVGGPSVSPKWIPHSCFPNSPRNCHPFNPNSHPGKYLEGSECSEATSPKRGV